MYLTKSHYIKNWNFEKKNTFEVIVKKNGKTIKYIKPERISHIKEDIGSWRKANAIHGWFVENVQNGEDDCKEYYVSREQLGELLKKCQTVLKYKKIAPQTLPTQAGFFYGNLEYDENYFQDIKDTEIILTQALAEPDEGDFYYQSNW